MAVAATVAVGGCSTIVDLAGVPRPGLQSDGRYVLTDSEIALECRGLSDRIDDELAGMTRTASRLAAERKAPPKTIVSLIGRNFGGPDGGLTNARLLDEGEARVRALGAEQRRRNCPGENTAFIEARIAEARNPLATAEQPREPAEPPLKHAEPAEDAAIPQRL